MQLTAEVSRVGVRGRVDLNALNGNSDAVAIDTINGDGLVSLPAIGIVARRRPGAEVVGVKGVLRALGLIGTAVDAIAREAAPRGRAGQSDTKSGMICNQSQGCLPTVASLGGSESGNREGGESDTGKHGEKSVLFGL